MRRRQFIFALPRRRGDRMRRREFILALGAAAALPLAVRAQPAMPLVGYLNSGAAVPMAGLVKAFHEGLSQAGYVEGRNVAVIVAVGGSAPAQAAKEATTTIPIVFVSGDDAIEAGLVGSLGQPGGNVTGISWLASALEAKRIGLLRELVPGGNLGVLVTPGFPSPKVQARDAQEAARELGIRIEVLNVGSERDVETIFANLGQQRIGSLVVNPSPMFFNLREKIIALAARHAVPTIYYTRDYPVGGGLMSY